VIFFDLDGVIRDLCGAVFKNEPENWEWEEEGEDLYTKVSRDLSALERAKPTEYYPLVLSLGFVFILSSQPKEWRIFTTRWLDFWFNQNEAFTSSGGEMYYRFVDSPRDKLRIIRPGDVLVEDYPYFNDYSQIILIDRKYNRNVENPRRRVKTVEELREALLS